MQTNERAPYQRGPGEGTLAGNLAPYSTPESAQLCLRLLGEFLRLGPRSRVRARPDVERMLKDVTRRA